MTTWTKEQEQAIFTRNCNLLVAAGAGSGKTAVLVERIISLISDEENPVDIDKLLVVTFTNAAALEMKERIGLAINKAQKNNPLSRHLYRQGILLNKASVMTLHAFCLEVIKENFYLLGIDPHFRIADETEAELLRLDVLEELLENYYIRCQDGDDFSRLIDAYGGQQDDKLIQELIIKLYLFSRSNPWPDHWLEQVIAGFTDLDWFQGLLPYVRMELETAGEMLKQAYRLAGSPGGPLAYRENLAEELRMVADGIGGAGISWAEVYRRIPEIVFSKLPRVKKAEVDPEIQERVKYYRDKAKDSIKNLANKYFQREPRELRADLAAVIPNLRILSQLVREFSALYSKAKIQRNMIDFSDLEHLALKLLLAGEAGPGKIVPSDLSRKLKEKYGEVMVDEYQDINDVQETILKLVSRDNNRFMVGDVKQSIYRFRLAKPELFQEKYRTFTTNGNSTNKRIDLSQNFRCRQEVVDGVNFIFKQIMGADLGEIDYNDEARLVCGAMYPPCTEEMGVQGPVELHVLEKNFPEEIEEEWTPLEREAIIMGTRLRQLVKEQYVVFDKEKNDYRPIRYSDIVILLRSPKGSAERIIEQFRVLGIPVYAELGSSYFKATEIQVMLALLKVIDNPRQDIPLAGVLRSPLLGLSAGELAKIRINCPLGDFYDAVLIAAEKDESELGEKLREFITRLRKWRTLARQDDLPRLIWTLYRETGYFDYAGAMPGGSQRQANLRALHDRARQYEETSFRGLFMFLRYLERLAENKSDLEAAKALNENADVVRIMSIHKSKGLEFPVVFVAGLGKDFNMLDTRQDITLHKDLGLGPVYIDPEKRLKYPTIAKLAIDNKIKFETLAEEMRILYVALTRAREKLVLVGSLRNLQRKIANWDQLLTGTDWKIPDSFLAQGNCYLDWLGPALIRHRDGSGLKAGAGLNDTCPELKDKSSWQVKIYQEELLVERDAEVAATREMLEYIKDLRPIQVNPYYHEKIKARLDWIYPYQDITAKSAKVTVTEIKHKFRQPAAKNEDREKPYLGFSKRPLFLQKDKGLSPAERGSALHTVMQHLDLRREISKEYLGEFLTELEKAEILSREQKEIIDVNLILSLLSSPLGKRLRAARKIKREIPFSLTLDACEVYEDLADCREKVLIQGVIDCLWYEKDGWVLLDYKSDDIRLPGIPEFVRNYQGQINLYARAVETIMKEKVKERYLYLFRLGQAVKL
ncbi:MAG: helicase-exonuclease AddAB subunit AddA [Peptococcaceae bacterium]